VERDGDVLLSDWRVLLLQTVAETGSLARAAETLGVPYRTAWQKITEVEQRLGIALLETHSGGADGGHSALTPHGKALVERFKRVTDGIEALVRERFHAELAELL